MVETAQNRKTDEEEMALILRSIKEGILDISGAFELCQKKFPQVTEDVRSFVTNLPKIYPGFWTKAYASLDGSQLLDLVGDEGSKRFDFVGDLKDTYITQEGRGKLALFDAVFVVTREYLRPNGLFKRENAEDAQ